MNSFKIVVVDDEPKITNMLCRILREAGYSAYGAYEAEGALMLCRHHAADMLISDVNMPAITGIELAKQVCRELPRCHIVLLSRHSGTAALLSQATASGSCLFPQLLRVFELRRGLSYLVLFQKGAREGQCPLLRRD